MKKPYEYVAVYNGTELKEDHTNDHRYSHLKPWKPGESGNPAGRPKGARNKFAQDFVQAFAEHWAVHGVKSLDHLAENDQATYCRIAVGILPKVVEMDDETKEAIQSLSLIPFNVIRDKLSAITIESDESEPDTAH